MRQSFLILIALAGGFFSCKEISMSTSSCTPPMGRYINMTVLDKCPEAMPSDIPHFCFELNFRGKDSVDIDNGFERFSLPYMATGEYCQYKIAGASLFGDMIFKVNNDSTLMLIDTAWTKVDSFSYFGKINQPEKKDWSFHHLLNECMIAGEYAFFKGGEIQHHKVEFLSNGQINGLKPYLAYTLCYAGDCLEETDPPARTIDLIDDKGGRETFVFKFAAGKMSIEFYSIGDPIPDIKGGRSIGPMVYEFRTE